MALSIVRNDITKMRVDAIVNSTNEQLIPGGLGVDASIHYAAGPELAAALQKIGYCPTGSCVMTDAFNIGSCKYIIHAVGPVYDPAPGAESAEAYREACSLIESCYRSIYRLASEKGCRSVAVPLISAGANGFPKAEVYRIATGTARSFLLSQDSDDDLSICIVLYDNESIGIGRKVGDEIRHHISDQYRMDHAKELEAFTVGTSHVIRERRVRQRPRNASEACLMLSDAAPCAPLEEREDYRAQDKSFPEMCEWWCSRKHISKHRFYTDANITKATFWAMKNNPCQVPKKTNVLACAIGLRLNLEQTKDLLARAGMALSPYYKLDLIVEDYILKKKFDIDAINADLFDEDLALLGAVVR